MLSLVRGYEINNIRTVSKIVKRSLSSKNTNDSDEIEFRVLNIFPPEDNTKSKLVRSTVKLAPTIAETMTFDTDWQSVWPAARTFSPYVVPLPLKQGYKSPKGIHPDKYGNTELMKIPNFLHLSPPVIKRHCEALKRFCTKWPKELETKKACEKYYPVDIITSDYCFSAPSIREPLARIVNLKVKLSSLDLNAHAKDKILRLVGDRYDPQTGVITITADRAPTRKQNLDYVKYLLTALFHISRRYEPWEAEKSEADMEYYDWDKNKSKESLMALHSWPKVTEDSDCKDIPHVEQYKTAVTHLINKGENRTSINKYKHAVKNVLNLKYGE